MPASAVSIVLFDLGGVLFRYQPDVRWQAFAEQTDLTPEEIRRRLSSSGYAMACDQGRFRGNRAYREGILLLGSRMSMERFVQLWLSAFRPDEAVLDIARRLREAGLAIATFSNNSDLVRDGLEAFWPAVLAPFMPRIFSADLGLTKPDPRAYQKAAELLGHPPAEVLVVDDAPMNTAMAASLGFETIDFVTADALNTELEARGLL
jgi:HAD superfamily hydrolase (TIGR01509 family)